MGGIGGDGGNDGRGGGGNNGEGEFGGGGGDGSGEQISHVAFVAFVDVDIATTILATHKMNRKLFIFYIKIIYFSHILKLVTHYSLANTNSSSEEESLLSSYSLSSLLLSL